MSMYQLDTMPHYCSIEQQLRDHGRKPDETRFVAATIQVQQKACFEELGDDMRRDENVIADVTSLAGGKPLDLLRARDLSTATIACLGNRYLGICSAAESCDGARNFAKLAVMITPVAG